MSIFSAQSVVVCFVNTASKWIMASLLAWRIVLELRIGLKVTFPALAEVDTISTLHRHFMHAVINALSMCVQFVMLLTARAIMNYARYCTLELPLSDLIYRN